MKSDEILEQGASVACCMFDLAERLPRGIPRFVGYILAFPLSAPFLLISMGWAIVGTIKSMWEHASK